MSTTLIKESLNCKDNKPEMEIDNRFQCCGSGSIIFGFTRFYECSNFILFIYGQTRIINITSITTKVLVKCDEMLIDNQCLFCLYCALVSEHCFGHYSYWKFLSSLRHLWEIMNV